MALLDAKARANLPDSAFAYIDSGGRRRLPINDEAHVRNALARFNQTTFEDEAARDGARTRLLKAARKFGIVPVGFMTGQLRTQAQRLQAEFGGRAGGMRPFPTGSITLLFADLEDSTGLVRALGNRYPPLLADVRRLLRAAIRASGGREVDARADEMFAVFESASAALEAALAIERTTLARAWPGESTVKLRVGLHTGRATLTDAGYVGLVVNTASRICYAGHGGQIVLSVEARDAIQREQPAGVDFKDLGRHQFQGLPAPIALYQVEVAGLAAAFPPPRGVAS
jgi:class 3 adenylate cyclase